MSSNFGRHSYEYFSSELAYFAQGLRPKVSHSILVLPLSTHYEQRLRAKIIIPFREQKCIRGSHDSEPGLTSAFTLRNRIWVQLISLPFERPTRSKAEKRIDPKTKDWRRYFVCIFRLFQTQFLNEIKPHILNTIPLQGILRKYMSLHVHNLVLNGFRLSQTTFSPFSHLVFHFPLPRIYA